MDFGDDNSNDRLDPVPTTTWLWENKWKVLAWTVVGLVVAYVVVGYFMDWWPWNMSGFEPFRAWNACPMHDGNTPYPFNTCNRHNLRVDGVPAPLGNQYNVQLLDNKLNGCSCTCTCPDGERTVRNLSQAGANMLTNAKTTQLPSVQELQSYAKNLWNSTLNDPNNTPSTLTPASASKNGNGKGKLI